jgi:exopolysaccharide production protein ExoZ
MNHPIKSVQYLRGIAALMVVWHHSFNLPGIRDVLGAPSFGAAGVDLFFVISGFIMVVSTFGRSITPREFMASRIIRVVPLYWCATLLVVALALTHVSFKLERITIEQVAKSLLFVPFESFTNPGHLWPLLVPGWTLNYEMFFYAVFATSLFAAPRWRLAGFALLFGELVMIGYIFGPFSGAASVYTDPRLLEFLAGMLIANFWVKGKIGGWGWLMGGASIIGGFVLLAFPDSKACMIAGASMIVLGALTRAFGEVKSRLLLALGDASYSIYLTHIFTLGALRVVWVRLVPEATMASSIALMGVSLCASAIVGYAVFRWVEKPLTERLKLKRRGKSAASVAAGGVSA